MSRNRQHFDRIRYSESAFRALICVKTIRTNPTRLSELSIGDELFSRYAEDAVLVVGDEDGNLPGRPPLSKADIIEVLNAAL